MKHDVVNINGNKISEKVEMSPAVFKIEPNDHSLYLAVNAELSNMRQGTHKTKTKGEVSGGGRKPRKQKGSGMARAGSNRSPIWVGGGTTFGPTPHKYHKKLTKKLKTLARKSAFSYKLKDKEIIVIDSIKLKTNKTKELVTILKNLDIYKKKITILVNEFDDNVLLASQNIAKLFLSKASFVSAYDIIDNEVLLIEKEAIEKINSLWGK
ncbi:MAG: 50S ribosomal protein L4 [Candidatus Marinimicrobia bacterium]|nr:50S ribosomal protein L4 [Candidatus Neomarinimicrobiota bacterium]